MPLITRHIRPTTALRGSNVTLTCIATTNSMSSVTVEWTKDNKVLERINSFLRCHSLRYGMTTPVFDIFR